jgi:hypothetical protein
MVAMPKNGISFGQDGGQPVIDAIGIGDAPRHIHLPRHVTTVPAQRCTACALGVPI